MISVSFEPLAKDVRVEFAANQLIVASQGTKVLPSVCVFSAGSRATAEYPRPSRDFHPSQFNQELRSTIANQLRRLSGNTKRGFSAVD